MNGMTLGLIGGVLGTVFGILGGVLGTVKSYQSAPDADGRRQVLVSAAALTALITSFLVAMVFTPMPWRFLLWMPYAALLFQIRTRPGFDPAIKDKTPTPEV